MTRVEEFFQREDALIPDEGFSDRVGRRVRLEDWRRRTALVVACGIGFGAAVLNGYPILSRLLSDLNPTGDWYAASEVASNMIEQAAASGAAGGNLLLVLASASAAVVFMMLALGSEPG